MSKMQVTVLGCGNSSGVPAVGNYWGACDPAEPKNNRTRSSIALQKNGKTLLIDTGPDMRQQLNRENIKDIAAALYTHHHNDHTAGMDELRILRHRNKKDYITIYANEVTLNDLQHRFNYLFEGGAHALYPPIVEPHILGAQHFGKEQMMEGFTFIPFEQDHGTCETIGYRFGDFAYSVDILTLDQAAVETLKGIKIWLVDAAAYNQTTNPVHANLEMIYKLNEQIGAQQVYLTSLSVSMDYQTLIGELPNGYEPAYDGMSFECEQ